jgi:hypothetical protein
LRTLPICALAVTLVGCSRQPPPPQVAGASCASPNPLACFMAVGMPMPIEISFRSNSARPAPTHDKTAARAEAPTRPRNTAGRNDSSPYREVGPRAIQRPATEAQHVTCHTVSTAPCTLRIPVCPSTPNQRPSCIRTAPAFLRKWRPLSA